MRSERSIDIEGINRMLQALIVKVAENASEEDKARAKKTMEEMNALVAMWQTFDKKKKNQKK